jgi:tetratricopeptide (TPR) repeat protein
MKMVNLKSILVVVAAVGFIACNPLSKMAKKAKEVNYTVTPNPLEMHADSIMIDIQGSIPAKFFNKKVSVSVTPVLEYGGKSKEFKAIVLSGEASEVQGTKISYLNGGTFTHRAQIAYEEGMHKATLSVKAEGAYKAAKKSFDAVKIAEGTNITPLMLQNDDKPILGADNFQRITAVKSYAEIHYLVNSPQVRGTELSDADMKAMKKFMTDGVAANYVWKNCSIDAYASPDGEITLNENLANDRASSAAATVKSMMSSAKAKSDNAEFYGKNGKGEDWAGFKTAMEASDIADKSLILRVLEMYSDPMKREEEIKNLAATYVEVADKILPKLRRSQITLNAEIKGRSDEEITALLASAPESLSVEELLFAATLTNDLNAKLDVYNKVKSIYPEDWRGPNNVGYVYILQNKLNEAKAEFEKAAGMNVNNAAVNNNLGVVARRNGNIEGALEYYESAEGTAPEVSENLGLVYVKKGDYDKANQYYGSTQSFNASLAKLLGGDIDGSAKMLSEITDKDEAYSNYLKAIIEARNNNQDAMIKNLKAAVAKDGSYKAKAKEDIEFVKFWDNSEFQAATN